MPLIGIIANKKDIKAIKNSIPKNNIEIVEITTESIENIKNIKFDEIIVMKKIHLTEDQHKNLNTIVSKVEYLIINADINIEAKEPIKNPIKVITFGFNSKSTITISSVKENKIIIYIQRKIEKNDKEIIEAEEKEMKVHAKSNEKIYNNLVVFILKELHNFKKKP